MSRPETARMESRSHESGRSIVTAMTDVKSSLIEKVVRRWR